MSAGESEGQGAREWPPLLLAWGVFALGAALYLVGFFQRVAPAVMTAELMRDFEIGAAALGNLSGLYFYAYVAMQVPTGLLADAWGPRRLLTAGAVVAAGGAALFGLASGLLWAGVGRFLVGGAVAVAFVGCLKLATHWFHPRSFSLVSGLLLLTGILGAVFAGVPLRLLVDRFGWRPVMLASAAVTAAVAVAIWRIVRDDPAERGYRGHAQAGAPAPGAGGGSPWRGLAEVARVRNAQLLAIVPGGIVGSTLAFAGLWGVPFLGARYGMPRTEAAAACSLLLVAWAAGGPVFGGLSDRLGRRRGLYAAATWLLLLLWSVLLLGPRLPSAMLWPLLAVLGFLSGAMIVGFAFVKESVAPHLAGTATGLVNMGVMTGPMVLQPLVGFLLDRAWDGTLRDGARVYPEAAWRLGLSPLVVWLAISAVLILRTREPPAGRGTSTSA